MWPFGKKKEKSPEEDMQAQREELIQSFAQKYLPEEFTILALTDAKAFTQLQKPQHGLAIAGAMLVAWLRDGEEEIHQEEILLLTMADERLLGFLQTNVPRNFIIKTKVRAAKDGKSFQLVGMPEPGFDPDLKALLEERKKPVTLDGGELGTFTLNRTAGWFDTECDWNGVAARLIFDAAQESEACFATARALMADTVRWDERARAFAARQLFPQLLPLAQEGGEELTEEELAEQLDPDFIMAHADGSFELWYGDGGIFWGKSLKVTGSLADGVTGAFIEE